MYGTLLHRGVLSTKKTTAQQNRRLIQFFVTLPSKPDLRKWKNKMIIKWGFCGKQHKNLGLFFPIINQMYGYQQATLFQFPFFPNYIDPKYQYKLVIPFSLPVEKLDTSSIKSNISKLLRNNQIDLYTCNKQKIKN